VTVQTGDGGSRPGSGSGPGPGSGPGSGSSSGVRPRRRDRHGRGLRGRLVPPGVPLYRSRAQQFDDLVLEAVARLEPRWETELSDVEFAVQEVPDADTIGEDEPVPLARIVRGQVISLKTKEYIEAARAMGARPWRIMLVDLLPNVMGSGVTHELCQCQALRLAGMLNSYGHKKNLPASAESLFISRMGPSGNLP